MSTHDQVCVVPFHRIGDDVVFCLITSHSGDWIFPKGNIDPGETPEESALKEAREEAGLSGRVLGKLTEYSYAKLGRYTSTVLALLMEVDHAARNWEEEAVRRRRWVGPDEARRLLERDELREALRAALAHLSAEARVAEPAESELDSEQAAVVILEDDAGRVEAMRAQLGALAPQLAQRFFDNAPDMLAWLEDRLDRVALVSLDHDLGPSRTRAGATFDPGDGRQVVDWLEARAPSFPVIVHTSNHLAAPGMTITLELAGWQVERVPPFCDLDWVGSAWAGAVQRLLQRE